MTWDDDFHHSNGGGTESMSRRPTRPRGNYVPPHLRNSTAPPPRYSSTESTRFPRSSLGTSSPSYRGRGRGGGGRGRGRSHFPSYSLNREQFENYPHYNDVMEKFDELEVLDDEENDTNGMINFDVYDDIPVDVNGSDVPAPVTSFDEVDLGAGLSENIKRCKYVKPTPVQKYAIPIAVAGRDLMACAQTGSGKTAAFCFPIISGILEGDRFKVVGSGRGGGARMAYPSALILSPTRELTCQIHDEAKKFAHNTGLKIVVAYGGAPIGQQFRNLERGVDILVATPGRLVDMIERVKVSLSAVRYLALDEADRMLDMGFEPQIRKIVQRMGMPPPGQRQTMLFSATFPHEIQRLASDFLSNYIFLTVGRVGSSTDLIAQRIELVQDMDKRNHLMRLLRTQSENRTHGKRALTLIFVETKRGADSLENWLSSNGFPAAAIHGDKVQMERERALKYFKSGATPILVATDVASRGLDIPHVSHVINFDLPKDIDSYVHRIGRTGRAGKSGHATAFFNDKNASLAKSLVELMKEAKQEVPSWLSQFAENSESSSYGGDAGRSKRYGSSNFGSYFGSYDFRSDAQYGNGSYNNSSPYNGGSYASSPGGFGYGAPAAGAPYVTAGAPYVSVSPGYHDPVVATGWD